MDTSKSTDASGDYTGGASLYSGRRDPTWNIGRAAAGRLQSLWDSLETYDGGALPFAPPLGYRGSFLRDAAQRREWHAYRGAVTLKSPEGSDSRRDENREFERLLLSSAPDGLIAPELLDAELRR